MGTLIEIALPVGLIAAVAIALPFLLAPRRIRSQRRLALSVSVSAIGLFFLGGALFSILYEMDGKPLILAVWSHPKAALYFLMRRAALTAVIWAPLLGLAWLSLARRLERLRAEEGMNDDPDRPDDEGWDEIENAALDQETVADAGEISASEDRGEGPVAIEEAPTDFVHDLPFKHRPNPDKLN